MIQFLIDIIVVSFVINSYIYWYNNSDYIK